MITYTEAQAMISTAYEQMKQEPSYRLGQALFNLMDKETADYSRTVEDHYKWYNSKDLEWCFEYFFTHFVE